MVIYRPETTASDQVLKVLSRCKKAPTLAQIGEVLMMSSRVYIKRKYVNPLIESALLEMTIPEKPTSSQQKYRITAKGLELLARNSEVCDED